MIRRSGSWLAAVIAASCLLASACSSGSDEAKTKAKQTSNAFYEIFVRSFADSNGDGIGDLNGVTSKLDYVKSLGADGIWLMPVNPSPSYHGYDVTDYYGINSQYGTMEDFEKLLTEAHKRGIRVIMDLVLNHTSSEHPWFKDSESAADSKYRDWYVWASKLGGDVPADGAAGPAPWHKIGSDQYLGIFWDGMPDLNFENPAVRKEMIKVGQYWLKKGVDGFRLDAAKHIYGDFKTTVNSKSVQKKNQAWWQEFRAGLNEVNPNAYLVGEVWDTTAIIGPYLDKALNSAFNFDLAAQIIAVASSEKATDIGFTLSRVHEFYAKNSGGAFMDAPFLSNHDQARVMTALEGNVNHARMAAAMLLTLPGNAFIYYGEELGMTGNKPDEQIREPFPWSGKGDNSVVTTWEPSNQGDISEETEDKDSHSLLNTYRTLLSWRAQEPALRSGTIASYETDNDSVVSYMRSAEGKQLLVLHNVSGKPQTVAFPTTKAKSNEQPAAFTKLLHATDKSAKLDGSKVLIPAYTSVVLSP